MNLSSFNKEEEQEQEFSTSLKYLLQLLKSESSLTLAHHHHHHLQLNNFPCKLFEDDGPPIRHKLTQTSTQSTG